MAAATVSIRRAEPRDTGAIHRAFVTAIRAIGSQFYTDEQKQAWEDAIGPESWSTRMLELTFFVAEDASEVIGFVSWYEAEIVHIYVSDTANGKGVGTQLMKFALENMEADHQSLTASLNAEHFYTRFGFISEENLIKERGGVPIPCIRMRRASV